ncbi:MAG: aminotransferase class V-fold PLP-dependent enzyme, partial [Fibromonadales bacterium]|nr:aminotransferase class V-fold PLP-dependent enzyme [Fibromonadales bacterium]
MNERIPYSGRIYDNKEIENLTKAVEEFWLTAGHWTAEFEKKLANYLGLPFCLFVNSGSSANLLAFMALTSPLLEDRAVKRGDEVITVAAGFPTTIAPVIQFGAIPVFVDITVPQYNINISALKNALSEKTKAVFIAHTLGNPFDISAVKDFCEKNNLWLIEDNCDALGSEFGEENRKTGTFG